jgi:hypothetical protein
MLFNVIRARLFAVQVSTTNLYLTGDFCLVSTGVPPDVTGQLNRTIWVAATTRAKRA